MKPPPRKDTNIGLSRVLGLICVWWLASAMVAGAEENSPRVLLLFSSDRLLPANQRVDDGIRSALVPQGGETAIGYFGEFLDATRMGGPEREAAMEDYLKRRYQEMHPHVLVAVGPQALEFLIKHRATTFPGVPLLFGGVSVEELKPVGHLTGLAGLPMEVRLPPMIESLLEMRPETREIVIVHGTAPSDRQRRDIALEQCAEFGDRVKISEFPELPINELKARLAELSPDQAVLYLTYFQGPDGATHTPAHVAREIAESSSVPVIGPYDTYIGSGVLGVCISTFENEGKALGKLIRRVLDGESPQSIGVQPTSQPRLILDERELKRWNIKSVPAGAEIRFHDPTLWENYPVGTPVGITVVALQGLLIAGLLVARRRLKRRKRDLRMSEARFSGIFRGSPVSISIVRKSDGRVIDVNPAWEAITGMSRADAIDRSVLDTGLVIEGDAEDRLRSFLESEKPVQDYDQVQRTRDGQTRMLSISSEHLVLNDEPCVIILAKDVTASRLEEETRRELARTARLVMLGEMTATIAHEVNQPLGAILSNADAAEMLLERDAPPLDEIKLILADIRRDDFRASEVIKRVRCLFESSEVSKVTLDINQVIHESLELIPQEAHRRGVALDQELAAGLPQVYADRIQIQQVLLNLLLNAMDAMKDTPLGTRKVTVRSCVNDDNSVVVSVEDRGHGIPAERIGRVFDSFFSTKEGGMGLGLALSRSIAEAYGGSVTAENNTSTGATFSLILPGTHDAPRA